MFFTEDGEFLGMSMFAGTAMNPGKSIEIKKSELEKFDRLTEEFIGFMRQTRDKRAEFVEKVEREMDDVDSGSQE